MTEVVYRCYLAVVAVLAIHGLHRLVLLWAFRRRRPDPAPPALVTLPFVTVQLPVYNERDVVCRLIDAVSALDWPTDRFEIQLLDDSSDDTAQAAAPAIDRARARGLHAVALRRNDREGFKAGALAYGMQRARGQYIAIFDADFLPSPGFLRQTIPHLVGGKSMVQVRWGHLNRDANALTRTQAALLDGHFVVEQPARQSVGAWFNFNGTAGVWNRSAIEAAGGWQHDTLTEDLDLSYRALLGGAAFLYLEGDAVPAEVPDNLPAFLAQQRRWARGSIQTARKLLPRILRSAHPLRVKAEATAHLGANLAWPLCVLVGILLPLVVLTRGSASLGYVWLDLPIVGFSLLCNAAFYRAGGARWRDLPQVLALGIGMAPSQAAATFEGLFAGTGEFVRTPKNGGGAGSYRVSLSRVPVEPVLSALNLGVAAWALTAGHFDTVPFLLLFGLGYGWVGVEKLRHPQGDRAPAGALRPDIDEALAGK